MKSFLLLILSLMAGCEVTEEMECGETWSEFICVYPKTRGKYQLHDRHKRPQRNMKTLTVNIKQHENFWNQWCNRPGNSSESVELEFEVEDKKCPKTQLQNTYRGLKTTITCDHSGNKQKPKFFCKDKNYICEDFLSNNSSLMSDGRFSITDSESGFGVSISNVSQQDAGVYWCGVQSSDEKYIQTVVLTKIQLKLKEILFFRRSPTIGTNFTYWCGYKRADCDINCTKFICKGEDPYRCERLASTTEPDLNERFSMTDNTTEKNITITVREVTTNDAGTYWCGAESRDQQHNQQFFNKFSMNVAPSTSPEPSTTESDDKSTFAHEFKVVCAVISCVAVFLLLLLLLAALLIYIYKRWSLEKQTRIAAAEQHPRENNIYEEIEERLQNPDSENVVNSIYVTANLPANPADSLHYSTIYFQSSSNKGGGVELRPKPSSSACQYSAVKYSRSSTGSTVNQPSGPTGEPLYSRVNKPRKQ